MPGTGIRLIEPLRVRCARSTPAVFPVRRFWEKPSRETARDLLRRGCVWNSMVMVGLADAFTSLIQTAMPDLVAVFEPVGSIPGQSSRIERVYSDLPSLGFSERVLCARPERCLVKHVTGVAWTDLGNSARFLAARQVGHSRPPAPLVSAVPAAEVLSRPAR